MRDGEPVVAWRRPAKGGRTTPLVVFLHGRGADEKDLLDLADRLPRAFAYASLRGPVACECGGRTWFESRAVARPVPESLRAGIRYVRSWLDDPARPYAGGDVFLLGFSAGMMMAGALLLDDPARFAGAALLSGALALGAGPAAPDGRLAGRRIFRAHGDRDDVIPAALVAETDAYLRLRSGADLTERRYPIGHAVSPREIADLSAWFEGP